MSPDPAEDDEIYDLQDPRRGLSTVEAGFPPAPAVRQAVLTVTTSGPAGRAAGRVATSGRVAGAVLAVHVEYRPGVPPSTDVRVATCPEGRPGRELLVVPDAADGGYFAPDSEELWRPMPTTFSFVPFRIQDPLEVVVTQCDPMEGAVRVRVIFEETPRELASPK
jgi:hypothetical protein